MNQPALVKRCITGSIAKQKQLFTFNTSYNNNVCNQAEAYD